MSASAWRNVLFLNIETVPAVAHYELLDERMQRHWSRKASTLLAASEQTDVAALYASCASIYAEFGKVACISVGGIRQVGDQSPAMRIKTLLDRDERSLLRSFAQLLDNYSPAAPLRLCAHNGKEFDFPYLCRRLLVNRLPLPASLNYQGKKPWEVNHLDTMDLWKFGDHKHYTPIDLLGSIFGIPNGDEELIDPAQFGTLYHHEQENGLERIGRQCAQSVVMLVQVYLALQGIAPIDSTHISYA